MNNNKASTPGRPACETPRRFWVPARTLANPIARYVLEYPFVLPQAALSLETVTGLLRRGFVGVSLYIFSDEDERGRGSRPRTPPESRDSIGPQHAEQETAFGFPAYHSITQQRMPIARLRRKGILFRMNCRATQSLVTLKGQGGQSLVVLGREGVRTVLTPSSGPRKRRSGSLSPRCGRRWRTRACCSVTYVAANSC